MLSDNIGNCVIYESWKFSLYNTSLAQGGVPFVERDITKFYRLDVMCQVGHDW